jgi:hypothetical protein
MQTMCSVRFRFRVRAWCVGRHTFPGGALTSSPGGLPGALKQRAAGQAASELYASTLTLYINDSYREYRWVCCYCYCSNAQASAQASGARCGAQLSNCCCSTIHPQLLHALPTTILHSPRHGTPHAFINLVASMSNIKHTHASLFHCVPIRLVAGNGPTRACRAARGAGCSCGGAHVRHSRSTCLHRGAPPTPHRPRRPCLCPPDHRPLWRAAKWQSTHLVHPVVLWHSAQHSASALLPSARCTAVGVRRLMTALTRSGPWLRSLHLLASFDLWTSFSRA